MEAADCVTPALELYDDDDDDLRKVVDINLFEKTQKFNGPKFVPFF